MNTIKTLLAALILPLLTANSMVIGMEKEQSKNNRPLIKAIVYFNPEKPAFYATNKQLEHLNAKGIATPVLPIVREVAEVKVFESNGLVTNWLKQPAINIRTYEKRQSTGKTFSFAQNLQNNLAVENKVFPKFLPVELSFNCSNNSKIGLTIDQFPVQVTFASNTNFETEQNDCLQNFYDNPVATLSMPEIQQLVRDSKINSATTQIHLTFNGLDAPTATTESKASHSNKSYASEQGCYQKIIDNKIHPHTTALQYLRNRETGIRSQRRLSPEPDFDTVLTNALREVEFNTPKETKF